MINRSLIIAAIGGAALLSACTSSRKTAKTTTPATKQPVTAVVPGAPGLDTARKKPTPPGITDKVKSSKRNDGLFRVYQDTANGTIQLYVRKDQLGKEFIYQSFSINGPNALFLNQSMYRATFILEPRKVYDRIEFLEKNASLYYDKNNPVSKTKDVDKPEAVVHTEKIVAEDSTGYLIAADGLFVSEKLDQIRPLTIPGPMTMFMFNLGGLDPSKSRVTGVRSYPNNTDVIVDLAYFNPSPINGGGDDITDARYNRIRMQHTLLEMPSNDFVPRIDDPRVGYFGQQVTNLTTISPVPYRDLISKWFLKKKDPGAALSEPVEPIVFWVENTTPEEYRQAIVEAGLKWNEAFEKAGFKNAVQMKIMPDDAQWDPADVRYNVIRWVASAQPTYGAIGPSFFNPRTGQILGADITVEWFSGSASPVLDELLTAGGGTEQAAVQNALEKNINKHAAWCTIGHELKSQYVTGLTTLEMTGATAAEIKEMHKQFLTYLIMHEMGHTLGLNHNMKASQMLTPEEVNNKTITRQLGLQGSVMDYPAINVALDRTKQGDYYTTKAGPYDLWAIEYGYKSFNNAAEEKAGLKEILSRSNDPKLAFGNDADDMRSPGGGIDPRVQVNDMSSDMIAYAEDRFKLVNNLMGGLVKRYSKPDQSYAELRSRYSQLNGQRNSMISAVSRYVGGVYVDRSFPDQHSGNKPFTPVSKATQKKAIALLAKYVWAPDAFEQDKQVYPYLQAQRRGFNFFGNTEDFKVTGLSTTLQVSPLAHILHPVTLQRISNSRLYGNEYSAAEVMNDISAAIFDADLNGNVNVYRQYLQTAFVKGAAGIMDPKSPGYDDVAKAAALSTLKSVRARLARASGGNEETRAHRAALIFRIDKAMKAE